jgi:hypothetical protein
MQETERTGLQPNNPWTKQTGLFAELNISHQKNPLPGTVAAY